MPIARARDATPPAALMACSNPLSRIVSAVVPPTCVSFKRTSSVSEIQIHLGIRTKRLFVRRLLASLELVYFQTLLAIGLSYGAHKVVSSRCSELHFGRAEPCRRGACCDATIVRRARSPHPAQRVSSVAGGVHGGLLGRRCSRQPDGLVRSVRLTHSVARSIGWRRRPGLPPTPTDAAAPSNP